MFGSTCGAGLNNLMYMQRDVYPCGRMFHQEGWRLGRFDDALEFFPQRMEAQLAQSRAAALRAQGSARARLRPAEIRSAMALIAVVSP